MSELRIGKVSSIDYEHGTLSVVYENSDNSTTGKMPCINFNREYYMPNIGDSVVVGQIEDDSSRGVVIGTFWNTDNCPAIKGKEIYIKEFSRTDGKAYMKYSDANGAIYTKAETIEFEDEHWFTSLNDIMSRLEKLDGSTNGRK